jgi:hypothetical protein
MPKTSRDPTGEQYKRRIVFIQQKTAGPGRSSSVGNFVTLGARGAR